MTYREKMQLERPEAISDKFAGGVLACPGTYFPGEPHVDSCGKWNDRGRPCLDCWNTEMPTQTIKDGGEAPKTNGDRIRAMDDENLAWLLMDFRIDAFAQSSGNQNALPNTQKKIREWLQQPAEVDDDR